MLSEMDAYPKLTSIPVFGKSVHRERSVISKLVLCLTLQVLELFLTRISFPVKFFQCIEGACR